MFVDDEYVTRCIGDAPRAFHNTAERVTSLRKGPFHVRGFKPDIFDVSGSSQVAASRRSGLLRCPASRARTKRK